MAISIKSSIRQIKNLAKVSRYTVCSKILISPGDVSVVARGLLVYTANLASSPGTPIFSTLPGDEATAN